MIRLIRWNNVQSLVFKRCLFVPSNSLTNKRKRRIPPSKPRSSNRKDGDIEPYRMTDQNQTPNTGSIARLPAEVKKELKDLRSFTKVIAQHLKPEQENDSLTSAEKPDTSQLPPIDIEEATDDIFGEISGTKKLSANAVPPPPPPPGLDIPDEIKERLGLLSELLVPAKTSNNKLPEKQVENNWKLLLSQLDQAGGLSGLSKRSVSKFFLKIPPKNLKNLIPMIENMYNKAEMSIPHPIYYMFVRSLTLGDKISDSQMQLINKYFQEISKQTDLKIDHYETMILAYVKNNHMEKIDGILAQMKKKNIEILKMIYTSIVRGYIFYQKDHQRALDTFDSMKFLSQKTQPDEKVYTDVIVSCVMHREIERALDLYYELKDKGMNVNQNLLSTLAKGCSRLKQFKTQAWNFLFQVYDHGWVPNLQTYEHMLYIAARDGDVELTRALFYKMLQTNSVTIRAFRYLILSYSKYVPPHRRKEKHLILLNHKGQLFRQNILQDVDFSKPVHGFPFLPSSHIPDSKFVLAESSAIWAHTVMNNPSFLRQQTLVASYVSIALELGDFTEFKDRFDSASYLNTDGIPKVREIEIIEPRQDEPTEKATTTEEQNALSETDNNSLIRSPILNQLQQNINDNQFKAPRDSYLYNLAIKAAGKFKNYGFAQEILHERGQFRKSNSFKLLSPKQQNQDDFQFAGYLVECWTNMNLLEDAYAVVLLSVDRFPWSWRELGVLNNAAMKLGSLELAEAVRKVAQVTQVKHHGKIKRQDFKTYVMKRGY